MGREAGLEEEEDAEEKGRIRRASLEESGGRKQALLPWPGGEPQAGTPWSRIPTKGSPGCDPGGPRGGPQCGGCPASEAHHLREVLRVDCNECQA